jgi:hypothetical protein
MSLATEDRIFIDFLFQSLELMKKIVLDMDLTVNLAVVMTYTVVIKLLAMNSTKRDAVEQLTLADMTDHD